MEKEEKKKTKSNISILMIFVMVVGAVLIVIGLDGDIIPISSFDSTIKGAQLTANYISEKMFVCTGVITMAIGALGLSKK